MAVVSCFGSALREGERLAHVQAHLQVPPPRSLVRQHLRVPGRAAADRVNRIDRHDGRHDRPDRGDHRFPATHRRDLLIRADGAGWSHQLLDWLTAQGQVRGRRLE